MKLKKLMIIAIIFIMFFHFSIPGLQVAAHGNEENLNIEGENTYSINGDKELDAEVEEEVEVDSDTENTEGEEVPTEGPESTEPESAESEDNVEETKTETEEQVTEETEEQVTEEDSSEPVETSPANEPGAEKSVEKEEAQTFQLRIQSVTATLPYKKGDDFDEIIPVKVKLNALGFDGIAETGNFGNHTEKRVKEFQAYYGLKVTGQVDQVTLDKLNEVYDSPYQNNRRNSYTSEIKKMLNALGYDGLAIGPVFGNLTEKRVKEFQSDYGLKAHGIADEPTIKALKNAYNSQINKSEFKKGDNHPAVTEIKRKLNHLGFDGLALSSNFGSWTETRVKQFQSYYGLSVTGIADQKTQQKLDEVINSPYQNGKSDSYTTEIKKMLNALGYGGLAEGPVFGNLTEKRVKEFQSDYGLQAHGIADEPTIKALKNAYDSQNKSEFKKGDDHPAVIEMKRKLNQLGFDGLALSGNFGSWTETRVEQFQEYYGLPVTGIADQKTQQKLDEVINSPYQNGKSDSYTTEIKIMLNTLGYDGLAEGPVFGNLTEKRLKEFQNDYGLKVNGIADEPTIKALNDAYNKTEFKKGDHHSTVIDIKRKLNRLEFDGLALSGNFGNLTETRVEEFQSYYGLPVTGIADQETQAKLNEIYNSPYQKRKSNSIIAEIKVMLNAIGYNGLAEGPVFGNLTEKRVKEFQRDHNLKAHGIVDDITLTELRKAYDGRITYHYSTLTLEQALDIQMAITNPPPQTDKYRNSPAYISSKYVDIIQSGAIYSGGNVVVRTQPRLVDSTRKTVLSPGTRVEILGTVNGDSYQGSRVWYKIRYNNEILYAHSKLVVENATIAKITGRVNVRSAPSASSHIYGKLAKGSEVSVIAKEGNWYRISYNAWRNATRSDTRLYLDPSNHDEFQHLDLSSPAGATAAELNAYLKGKGILEGMGQAFIDASRTHHINELYLVSHALLETGHGTSDLAKGIVVKGKKVYNMFGIEAYDSCPNSCGSAKAYAEGWDTPEKAIIGGAKFIGERYIHNEHKQNTLYKMRWNPAAMEATGRFGKQYATDIGWAVKQTTNLRKMHEDIIRNPVLKFNIIQYR